MKIKLHNFSFYRKKEHLSFFLSVLVFSCVSASYGLEPITSVEFKKTTNYLQQQVKGTITDINGQPIPGVNIVEKGTANGAQSDFDGGFSITPSNANAVLVFSFVGFVTKEVSVGGKTTLKIVLDEDISQLDEVVVVGYGTQKKVNLTAAVSQVGAETFENRPSANVARSLQGSVPGLVISNSSSGGAPGADTNINIRGFLTSAGSGGNVQESSPLVLVDGIEMNLNDIDPESIETVSVLKDAAAASIYGSQAAGGAILITTKSGSNMKGKIRVTYSTNYALTQPTKIPELASPINFAYAVNDSRINNGQNPYHDETDLANILANMANPGSAPSIGVNAAGTNWNYTSIGIDATGATDWTEVLYKDWAERTKHNLSISGGDQKLNYYFSAGAYDEGGLLKVGDESFQRYNLDAKISSQVNKWLKVELLTKVLKSYSDYPTQGGTDNDLSGVLDLLSKIKPTFPLVDPIYGEEWLGHSYFPFWATQRFKTEQNQLVLLPRFIIEPIKDLKLNVNLNYKRSNNYEEESILSSQQIRPAGFIDRVAQQNTSYSPAFATTEYFSPNIFTTYDKSIGNHNLNATVGYQSEVNNFHSLGAQTDYLISDNVVSINASLDDDQLVSEAITHWATQSVFSRFRYNYKEKYLFEFSYRRDGSSRFAPEDRWAGFPSYSAGYNVAKENFWPIDAINTFKLRGSYGTLGNQNVSNYLYLSNIELNTGGTSYLFDGQRETYAFTPGLGSENLTWEKVKTTDIGFDLSAFNNKLDIGFSWYRTDIEGMATGGLNLPAQLGTNAPVANAGISRVQGWEVEAKWRQNIGKDFSYNIRAVLSDYTRSIVDYPVPDGTAEQSLTQTYYPGQDLGTIYGLTWDGWFLTDEEAANHPIDQSAVTGWSYSAGDTKYKDLDGDGSINRGAWEVGDTGDWSVLGNTTPRYQYAVNLGFVYKNLDFNAFIQGVGKRDVVVSNHQRFRGPAQGAFHANVWEEHLDYFRPEDTTNPLGPNLDAYFPAPYSANPGRNNKNYSQVVDRYIQNGAYARLKSLQLGYTIPKDVTSKHGITNFRLYVTGENLFTVNDMLFFDPENITAGVTGSAISYPLQKIVSMGLNVSF
ncbi:MULTISPECIES: TonB-dependent receptor [unclassified Algibacter]|uniref:SusC/RagA family TonB-linked outer membrane protein n=1 Tax=unclassified Algibacter TaxID=2615009 RepID=UPI00131BF0C4|nr:MULTISPECIES: TonB-dependent receptor [unclassified Algibacter]MCL5129162.1 TonB-dependent receptor [Algibacter sp. L4_22]